MRSSSRRRRGSRDGRARDPSRGRLDKRSDPGSVTVSDTGVGIPEEKLDLIFEPFEQVDGSTTRRYGGTGLGLAIASQLIELMGGRISAESQLGRGSTFRFSIRLGQTQQVPELLAEETEGPACRHGGSRG